MLRPCKQLDMVDKVAVSGIRKCLEVTAPSYAPIKFTTIYPEASTLRPKIVLCDVQNPMYGLYIVVPTNIVDNRGLPHTLEHLIFTGSRDHPGRGYLDKLATVCFSTGTNAYTSEDHTCYFVSTASFEGLLKLLPVYLDHVLHPRLAPEDMALEVFTLDAASKEARGVVYCEMKSRENTEADQLDIRLRNLAFRAASVKEDPFLETYRWECGGSTGRVSHLTPEEIRAYHRKYYKPENLTIFVSGKMGEAEETSVLTALDAFKYEPALMDSTCPLIDEPLVEKELEPTGQFPADDESIGSVGFSWLGPHSSDLRMMMALHILMRSLRDTTASPLFQEFVECPDPCANDIDYDVRAAKRALLTFIFSGVPTGVESEEESSEDSSSGDDEEDAMSEDSVEIDKSKLKEGLIRDRMFAVFNRLLEDDESLDRIIKSSLRSFSIKTQEQYQEDPHELALGYCLTEILNGSQNIGNAVTQLPVILEELKKEPIGFWKGIFKEYLIDQPCNEVLMYPSKEMSSIIKEAENKNLALVHGLGKYPLSGTALLDGFSDEMPIVGFPKPTLNTERSIKHHDGVALHLIKLPDTSFNTLTLGFNLKQNLDPELWPYLVLYQELLFQCDLQVPDERCSEVIPAGLMSYQDLQRLLSSRFTSYEAAIGIGNELFSASYLDSHLVLSATCPAGSNDPLAMPIPDALKVLLTVLLCSKFSKDRIAVTVDNLVSHLADTKRDPSTVIDALFTQEMAKKPVNVPASKKPRTDPNVHVSSATNIFVQEQLLKSIKESGVTDEVVEKLNKITRSIISSSAEVDGLGCFLHVGVGLNQGNNWNNDEDILLSILKGSLNMPIGKVVAEDSPCFSAPESLPRYSGIKSVDPESGFILVPLSDVTASFLACSVFTPLLPVQAGSCTTHTPESIKFYLSMAILCHMLSFTEGPLYNRIRGKGLAYGGYLSLSLWNGLVSFDLNDSTAPVEAFTTFLQLVQEVIQECQSIQQDSTDGKLLCGTTLQAAKASFAYTNVSDRSTPSNLFSLSLRSAVRGGYPSVNAAEHALLMETLQNLSLVDLAATVKPVLELFLEPSKRFTICVVPASSQETLAKSFAEATTIAPIIRTMHSS